MMTKTIGCCALGVLLAASVVADMSTTLPICLAPDESLLWKTAAQPFSVDLTWPSGAVSAVVEARDDKGVVATVTVADTTATNAILPIATPATEAEERVLSLTLTFMDSSNATVETRTARVGLVRGVNENPTRLNAAEEGTRAWQRVENATAVIPVEGETTLDGVAKSELSPPDWLFCRLTSGWHALASSVEGDTLEANVWRPPYCTVVMVR
jgi:hypothetical protein